MVSSALSIHCSVAIYVGLPNGELWAAKACGTWWLSGGFAALHQVQILL